MNVKLRFDIESKYFMEKLEPSEIAKVLAKDYKQIMKILKKEFGQRYEEEKLKRENELKQIKIERQDRMYNLFFQSKFTLTEIAECEGISIEAVSLVLSQHPDYEKERQDRNNLSKKLHKKKTIEYIEIQRSIIREQKEELAEELACTNKLSEHDQAVMELSIKGHMGDTQAVFSCPSAYKLSKTKNSLVWNKAAGARPWDMPKSLSLRTSW